MPVRQITHDEEVKLTQAALDARNASYSPYSKFRVGACFLSDDGKYWPGCNVENASYGVFFLLQIEVALARSTEVIDLPDQVDVFAPRGLRA